MFVAQNLSAAAAAASTGPIAGRSKSLARLWASVSRFDAGCPHTRQTPISAATLHLSIYGQHHHLPPLRPQPTFCVDDRIDGDTAVTKRRRTSYLFVRVVGFNSSTEYRIKVSATAGRLTIYAVRRLRNPDGDSNKSKLLNNPNYAPA